MSTLANGQPITRRNTRQRQLALDAVRSRCDHPTAEHAERYRTSPCPKMRRSMSGPPGNRVIRSSLTA